MAACIAAGSAVEATVGATGVDIEVEAGEDATGGGELCDFPHPLPIAKMNNKQRMPALSRQLARLQKSKIKFTGIGVDCLKVPQCNIGAK